ncbi:MAG: pentapeptide repeat-containing protein, partial [Leptolyngbyaceae cyanobacterium bins.302]|nr:pentapeptide repeat-containing protein [Leptolyngbyaceae cyanobacterium bins.302]
HIIGSVSYEDTRMRPHWKVRFSQETTIVSGIAVISAIALGLLIPASVRLNQDTTALHKNPTEENKREFDASLEHVKAIVGGMGTIATIVGGVVLYLNFRVAKQNTEIAEDKQVTERFSKAVDQLGSDKIEVRLGGIYSLERIAKDSPADHWTIMEVLTAFVRERTIPTSTAQPTVSTDVQAALTVIGRREVTRETKDQRLDLNGTNLSRASLQGANLQQASIQGANLERADLQESNLQATHLLNANLPMAIFQNTNLQGAYLVNANLQGANLRQANLQGAYLVKATLQEAYLVNANLQRANLQGANLQGADFRDVQLNDSILLATDLRKTQNLTLAQLTGDNPPLLCNVALPTSITGINPHRDCDQMPQKLVELFGGMSLEEATQVVNKAKQKQWEAEKIPPPHP